MRVGSLFWQIGYRFIDAGYLCLSLARRGFFLIFILSECEDLFRFGRKIFRGSSGFGVSFCLLLFDDGVGDLHFVKFAVIVE